MQHGDLELLKSFCYNIQDGHYGDLLENLQLLSTPFNYYVLLNDKSG